MNASLRAIPKQPKSRRQWSESWIIKEIGVKNRLTGNYKCPLIMTRKLLNNTKTLVSTSVPATWFFVTLNHDWVKWNLKSWMNRDRTKFAPDIQIYKDMFDTRRTRRWNSDHWLLISAVKWQPLARAVNHHREVSIRSKLQQRKYSGGIFSVRTRQGTLILSIKSRQYCSMDIFSMVIFIKSRYKQGGLNWKIHHKKETFNE
jgi:hypothetical protein